MPVNYIELQNKLFDAAKTKGIKTPVYDWSDNETLYQLSIFFIHRWLMEKHSIHVIATPKILYPDNVITNEYHYSIYKEDVGLLDKEFAMDGTYWGFYEVLYEGMLEVLKSDLI